MTNEEQKLLICEKLPGLIWVDFDIDHLNTIPKWKSKTGLLHDSKIINWPTEGLQVCHEAEKLLWQSNDWSACKYQEILQTKVMTTKSWTWFATYEQRLEALCRVWWPERWQ